jgi:branched-chain amino acid transport system permease protein
MRLSVSILVVFLAVLLLLPLVGIKPYYLSIATEILIFSILAMSLNLLVGYTGLTSLGHGAFFGVGAYAAALTVNHISHEIGVILVVSIIVTGVFGMVIGWLALKLAGFYFLMVTFAFTQIIFCAADRWHWLTGGSDGMVVSQAQLFGKPIFTSPAMIYYTALGVFLITWLTLRQVVNSPFGQTLVGIRENPHRMCTIGYRVRRYKMAAFVLSTLFACLAGILYVQFNQFISPVHVHWILSGNLLIMVILGGAGTLNGPVLGTAVYLYFQNLISSFTEYWMFVIGVLFIALITGARKGLLGLGSVAWDRLVKGRSNP